MPMRSVLFFFVVMVTMISSCSKIEEKFVPATEDSLEVVSAPSSVLLSDSLVEESLVRSIPSDSVRLVIELFDAHGSALSTPIPVTFVDDSYSEDLMSDSKGVVARTVHRSHTVSLMYGEDVISTYFDMNGGEELNDHIRLNILPMKGRIMDNKGVPHKQMPVHFHYRYSKKDRTMACDKDLLFHTDSLGYYRTYVAADFYSIVLHTCGFSFGVITKKEFEIYPKQNFLFDPFEAENRCAYNLPPHDFYLDIPFAEGYTESLAVKEWDRLWAMDEALETSEYVKLRVAFPHRSYSYKLKKKGGVFRVPVIRVCIK